MWSEEEEKTSKVEDFSASSTLIIFDPPLPLLRKPIPAGLSDDPSSGPCVLAFKDAHTWKSALEASQSKIRYQCEGGARIGCSVSASSKCKPRWWRSIFGGSSLDFSERERCEEQEMSACVALSKQSCLTFAKDKCLIPFRNARIAAVAVNHNNKVTSGVSQPLEVTNYRGGDILDSERIS